MNQVTLPVVVQEIVRSDGTRTLGFRVFCPAHCESVELDVCRKCPQSVEATGDGSASPEGAVVCRPQLFQQPERPNPPSDPTQARSDVAVGAVVAGSVCAIHQDLPLRALRSFLTERNLSSLFVIDESEKVVGIVRDVDLRRPSLQSLRSHPIPDDPLQGVEQVAGDIMSATLAICEHTPIRSALVQMAGSRARQVAIVTTRGELLATLVDVEGLRWLAGHSTSRL